MEPYAEDSGLKWGPDPFHIYLFLKPFPNVLLPTAYRYGLLKSRMVCRNSYKTTNESTGDYPFGSPECNILQMFLNPSQLHCDDHQTICVKCFISGSIASMGVKIGGPQIVGLLF